MRFMVLTAAGVLRCQGDGELNRLEQARLGAEALRDGNVQAEMADDGGKPVRQAPVLREAPSQRDRLGVFLASNGACSQAAERRQHAADPRFIRVAARDLVSKPMGQRRLV